MALRAVVFLVLLLIPIGAQQAFATLIDFETFPDGTTSLLLAGMQTNFSILTILGMVGAGAFATLYYISKRK